MPDAGRRDAITDVAGIKVGHWSDRRRGTGCTVVLAEAGATPGYHCAGGAPEGIATDLLRPENRVQEVHAVLLTGGSAFGLDAAAGVRAALRVRDHGLRFKPELPVIPIVTGAVLFDLDVGSELGQPYEESGRRAVRRATSGAVEQGSVGAGVGCTVAKAAGAEFRLKGGVGTASVAHGSGLVVGALAAVNAVGDIYDPETGGAGRRAAGAASGEMRRTLDILLERSLEEYAEAGEGGGRHTTLVVVATNAPLDKAQATRLAIMADDGLAQAIRPAHTPGDGDTVFALATGAVVVDVAGTPGLLTLLGSMAARAVARAIVRGVEEATGLGGVPSVGEWRRRRRRSVR